MDIHRNFGYTVIVICVTIPSLFSKTISLNDLIAAEEKSSSVQQPNLKVSESKTIARDFSAEPKLSSSIFKKHFISTGSLNPISRKLSPLNYKKTYQIRTPLRPKKIKHSNKIVKKRITATTKREITNDENFNRNYIPLLKSITVLFDNILNSDSSADDDTGKYYNRHQSTSGSDECPCASKSRNKNRNTKQAKKTIAPSSFITAKIPSQTNANFLPEASSTSTHITVHPNIGTLRRNKNLPILPTRNTTSSRRNHHGLSEGSLSTHYRNLERYITGDNGSDEGNHSGGRETESYTKNHEGNTNSSAGNYASCNGSRGTIGGDRNITTDNENETSTTETGDIWSNETFTGDRGDSQQHKGFNKFETGGNETESRTLLSESNSRLRGHKSKEETSNLSWQIESLEESSVDVTYNISSNRRIPDGDGPVAQKDQEFRESDKELTKDDILSKSVVHEQQTNFDQDNQKFVMIYDGYSIARDVNGDNKLTEKAYRIYA